MKSNQTPPATDSADTFARSCEHWSDAHRTGMDAFYQLAAVDYRHLAAAYDWPAVLRALPSQHGRLRLADVACGSGRFPATLLTDTAIDALDLSIDYDLLDPSRFSIETARSALAPPFVAGRELVCTAQDWPVESGAYSMVWATHALYCVPADELPAVAARFKAGLAPGGVGFVAQSTRAGHYVRFYDRFCKALASDRTPYCDIRQVADALADAGLAVRVSTLDYDTRIDVGDRQLLERYLQRCAFDERVDLDTMTTTPPLSDYLRDCEHDGEMCFAQQAGLLVFAHSATDLRGAGLDHDVSGTLVE